MRRRHGVDGREVQARSAEEMPAGQGVHLGAGLGELTPVADAQLALLYFVAVGVVSEAVRVSAPGRAAGGEVGKAAAQIRRRREGAVARVGLAHLAVVGGRLVGDGVGELEVGLAQAGKVVAWPFEAAPEDAALGRGEVHGGESPVVGVGWTCWPGTSWEGCLHGREAWLAP